MKKIQFLILFFHCLSINKGFCQTNIYLFPGQGSDKRLFTKIKFDNRFTVHHISYPTPKKGIKLKEFTYQISKQIDTSNAYIFIGVSLGGMICSELTDILHPQKTIIISSAKCRKELPIRYKFQKYIPFYKLIPAKVVYFGAKIFQPIIEPDRNLEKETFKSMLYAKSPEYLKRTADMIINWNKCSFSDKIIHIHGTNDHTLPIKHIKADYIIKNGSHMMALTKGDEINELILQILKKE
jgi:pimeloyl-ACP methyl ester carboxylesterase